MSKVQWRQQHFRPNKPLPTDTIKHYRPDRRQTFRKFFFDIIMSTLCLGLPYLFLGRSQHHRIDEEGGVRSPGPMVVVGACACLVVSSITEPYGEAILITVFFVFHAVRGHPQCLSHVHDTPWFGRRRAPSGVDRHPVLCVEHGVFCRGALPLESRCRTYGRVRRRRRPDVAHGMPPLLCSPSSQ